MDWKDSIRAMTEQIIHTASYDNENAWGNEGEDGLEYQFPAHATATITLNGKEHKIEMFCILDEELPYALEWRK